jgi:hypothetical protein
VPGSNGTFQRADNASLVPLSINSSVILLATLLSGTSEDDDSVTPADPSTTDNAGEISFMSPQEEALIRFLLGLDDSEQAVPSNTRDNGMDGGDPFLPFPGTVPDVDEVFREGSGDWKGLVHSALDQPQDCSLLVEPARSAPQGTPVAIADASLSRIAEGMAQISFHPANADVGGPAGQLLDKPEDTPLAFLEVGEQSIAVPPTPGDTHVSQANDRPPAVLQEQAASLEVGLEHAIPFIAFCSTIDRLYSIHAQVLDNRTRKNPLNPSQARAAKPAGKC